VVELAELPGAGLSSWASAASIKACCLRVVGMMSDVPVRYRAREKEKTQAILHFKLLTDS
jgi:predicted DNA-binding protein with PD1-like motif